MTHQVQAHAVGPAGALAQVSPDDVRPGVLGLVVVLALIVAVVLLLRSFTRHLRRVDFEEDPHDDPADPADPADPDGPAEPGGQDER